MVLWLRENARNREVVGLILSPEKIIVSSMTNILRWDFQLISLSCISISWPLPGPLPFFFLNTAK